MMAKTGKFFYLVIGLLVGAVFSLAFWQGIFSGPENFFTDLLYSTKAIDNRVVILAVDNESLGKIGQWPWPRAVFAETIEKMNTTPPAVLAFDVLFAESSRYGQEDDSAFAQSLAKAVFPTVLPVEANNLFLKKDELPLADYFVEPITVFSSEDNVSLALANIIVDKDGVARSFPLSARGRQSGKVYQALAFQAVAESGAQAPGLANLNSVNRIVFAASAGSIRTIPFWRVYSGEAVELLKDKIVFLGATAPDLHDSRLVPFGRQTEMPGAEIQANIANMLLKGYRLMDLPKILCVFWIILAAFLPALFFGFFKRLFWAVSTSLFFGFLHIALVVVLFQFGYLANFIHLTLAWLISLLGQFGWRYFIAEKEKRHLKDVFSRYVSKEVIKQITDDPSKIRLGGEEKNITVFFSDIRSFTTLSERTPPVKLVEVLNKYFTAMSAEILCHKGVLDKYIGDAIMAFWGAPIDDQNQADNALLASLTMLKKLKKLNQELVKEGSEPINIGIGLYTGPAVVGNIGSETRLNYTAMGDTVNVASRLEGLNKEYKTSIIVGQSVKEAAKATYQWRSLGSAQVKGRAEPVNIYTIDWEVA